MDDDLVVFLRARLDEDEAAAKAAARADGSGGIAGHSQWVARFGMVVDADDPDWAIITGTLDEISAHIALHDPARELREVQAKRALLDGHEGVHRCDWGEHRGGDFGPCKQVSLLAAGYSGHPDYREEWA